jgi:hypothetical protein
VSISHRSRALTFAVAAGFASAMLAACGGSSSTSNQLPSQSSPPPISSPTYVSAGDAPMNSVLAAQVTFSAITATDSTGKTVSLLSAPATIELSHLAGLRAPLAVSSLSAASYASISYTISGVSVSYVDGTGTVQPNVAATLSCGSNTTTCTFTPGTPAGGGAPAVPATVAVTVTLANSKGPAPLVVGDSTATDIGLDFNLASALDLTGTTVTFTPNATVSAAQVEHEATPPSFQLDGTASSVSASGNSVILQTATGVSVLESFATGALDDNLTVAALNPGTALETTATLNPNGAFVATSAMSPNVGAALGSGDEVVSGRVTAITATDSTGAACTPVTSTGTCNLASVTVVRSQSTNSASSTPDLGTAITVPVASTTMFSNTAAAKAAGMTTFDQTQVFVGQSIYLAWTNVAANAAANPPVAASMIADNIRPAAITTSGVSATAVTVNATTNDSTFTLTPSGISPVPTPLTASASAATAVNVTDANGTYTSAATLATGGTSTTGMAVGTTVNASGYLSQPSAGAYTLLLTQLQN